MIALLALWLQAAPPLPKPDGETPPDVVVTARPDQNLGFRLKPLAPWGEQQEGLPKVQVGVLGNGTLSAETEQGDGPAQANRAMIRLRIPM